MDDRVTGFSVTNDFGPGGTVQTSKLVIRENWKTLTPLVITFKENMVAGANVGGKAPPDDGGLNFMLEKVILNNTPKMWSAFGEKLTDDDLDANGRPAHVPDSLGTNRHPTISHFHTRDLTIITPQTWKLLFGPDPGRGLEVGGKPPVGDAQNTLDFQVKVHDILGKGFMRQFVLTETPIVVPEPATLVLCGIGSLGLIGYAGRRRGKMSAPSASPPG
jgi:hypothetical protein